MEVLLLVTEDRRAALKAKFLEVFSGLGKLEGYQLKFHIDEKVQPVAQPVRIESLSADELKSNRKYKSSYNLMF